MATTAVLSKARSPTEATLSVQPGRIARVEILRDMAAAEPIWRLLEEPEQFSTPYQRFDLLNAWQRQVGCADGIEPFIVVASDAERRPMLLMPLGLQRRFGVRIASFLGGKHPTFNMPLWRRDVASMADSRDIAALIAGLRGVPDGADVLALCQQPLRWRDLSNPLALLPNQPSVNDCPVLRLEPGAPASDRISNSFRRRLKSKEKKLQALPGYRYVQATTDADIDRLLDAFFRIKPIRMAAQKLPNVFAEPGVGDFVRQACHAELASGGRAIDIHALQSDDEMIALFAGVADGHRYSMMFNTYTLSDAARYSPGLILMRSIIDHYAEQGYRRIDLGVGSDDYKKMFCKDLEPIFDSYVALSARGRLPAAAMAAVARTKRAVKQSPALKRMAQKLRGALQRKGSAASADESAN
ncbi:GNAT family N-acetyltransferase [Rhodopseudomonas sp. HC1]|uniref:GNAT family N-acetyltransferase n=1 Tax=Rhodopseudomonas infernalis TaxID=2897386 RepID=UPI001EE83115|nr:GNAT family N-acetyltransferase [Rhodopseudomonas infernalis]MCG6204387.1 GNAT family N-acetyltransferase [Rhodopseudomonas infernalis]